MGGCKYSPIAPYVPYFLLQPLNQAEYFVSHLSEMKPCAQVVNVAKPGHSIEDQLESQLHRFFQRFPEIQSHNAEPPLDPHRTLIVLQMGINDCGYGYYVNDSEIASDSLVERSSPKILRISSTSSSMLLTVCTLRPAPAILSSLMCLPLNDLQMVR